MLATANNTGKVGNFHQKHEDCNKNLISLSERTRAHEIGNSLQVISAHCWKLEQSSRKTNPHLANIFAAIEDAQYYLHQARLQPELVVVEASEFINQQILAYPDSSIIATINSKFDVQVQLSPYKSIFINLINNALEINDYRDDLRIEIVFSSNKHSNSIQVLDNGIGMSGDQLETIFAPGVSYKSSQGLGLSFCRRAMKMMGGSISCSSIPHVQTCFTLTFPKIGGGANG
jgi:signal transduction histidine kinase